MHSLPKLTPTTNRRQFQPSAATGSAMQQQQFRQQQIQQDFQLTNNIATAAPPAHVTPQLAYFTHLQPPNVQPMFLQQSAGISSDTTTSSLICRSMNVISNPYSPVNLSQESFEDTLDVLQ